jgi:two-component system CheB/CheR fusion protein
VSPTMLVVKGLPGEERRRVERGVPLGGARIWLVDDDTDAHEVVSLTLQQAGGYVRSFASCKELAAALEDALRAPAQAARMPEVFLIDLAMPDEDGFETLRRIRALEMSSGTAHSVPAIALSAFTQIERERLLAAGFRDRVNKPVDADKLIAAIRAALQDGPTTDSAPRGGAKVANERRSA